MTTQHRYNFSHSTLSDVLISQHLSSHAYSDITTPKELIYAFLGKSEQNLSLIHQVTAIRETLRHDSDFASRTLISQRATTDRGLRNVTTDAVLKEMRFEEFAPSIVGSRSSIYNPLSEKRLFGSFEIRQGGINKAGKFVQGSAASNSIVIYVGLSNIEGIQAIVNAASRRGEALMHKHDYKHNFGSFKHRVAEVQSAFAEIDEYLDMHLESHAAPSTIANYRLAPDDIPVGRAYVLSVEPESDAALPLVGLMTTPYYKIKEFLRASMAAAASYKL